MEQDKLPCAPVASCACDQAVFERVWRRVMPQDRPDSPIVLTPAAAAPEGETTPAPAAAPAQVPAGPGPGTLVRSEGTGPCVPSCGNVPCLGPSSAVYGAQLQQYIEEELTACKAYLALARRTAGNGARVLSTMAADERRHAKRLSTAYFLISGVRYWPAEQITPPAVQPLMIALRESFGLEQQAECSYLAAAAETTDPCLRELYLELAGDEGAHAGLLRGILEQM